MHAVSDWSFFRLPSNKQHVATCGSSSSTHQHAAGAARCTSKQQHGTGTTEAIWPGGWQAITQPGSGQQQSPARSSSQVSCVVVCLRVSVFSLSLYVRAYVPSMSHCVCAFVRNLCCVCVSLQPSLTSPWVPQTLRRHVTYEVSLLADVVGSIGSVQVLSLVELDATFGSRALPPTTPHWKRRACKVATWRSMACTPNDQCSQEEAVNIPGGFAKCNNGCTSTVPAKHISLDACRVPPQQTIGLSSVL